jgi:hypothetical protein
MSVGIVIPEFPINENKTNSYISVLLYDSSTKDATGNPGTITVPKATSITPDNLLMEKFNFADVQVYQNRVYLLDYTQGIVSFIYDSQKGATEI